MINKNGATIKFSGESFLACSIR